MNTRVKKKALLAAPVLALGMVAMGAAPAFAATGGTSYQATLGALNHSGASGSVTVSVSGDQATVHLTASGLATTFQNGPYPHVAHIHINGKGRCPTASDDTNGDGVVSTVEGVPDYGMVGTTLSTSGDTSKKAAVDVKVAAGKGGSFTYDRTFTLNSATAAALKAGTAVVVVHGLNPATLSKKAQGEKSALAPALPLAATAPALCGALTTSQMAMPNGAAATGGGAAPTGPNEALLLLGGGLIAAAGAGVVIRRRMVKDAESR